MSPIKPYTAVGLVPTVRGIRKRADIRLNLEHLKHLVKAAAWLSSLDLPVRLIAIPEGRCKDSTTRFLIWITRSLLAKGQSIFPAKRPSLSAN